MIEVLETLHGVALLILIISISIMQILIISRTVARKSTRTGKLQL